ncbi:MAG: DUF302 domain-containing protein [Halobacteriales archaeon]
MAPHRGQWYRTGTVITRPWGPAELGSAVDGEKFRTYRSLGVRNPPLAHEAVEAERELGALLPCNVVVYEAADGGVGVSAVDPGALLSVVENPDLGGVATEVTARFERVLDGVAG